MAVFSMFPRSVDKSPYSIVLSRSFHPVGFTVMWEHVVSMFILRCLMLLVIFINVFSERYSDSPLSVWNGTFWKSELVVWATNSVPSIGKLLHHVFSLLKLLSNMVCTRKCIIKIFFTYKVPFSLPLVWNISFYIQTAPHLNILSWKMEESKYLNSEVK
jgi:hypothetical protein